MPASISIRTDSGQRKNNEITAIPKLLSMLDIENSIITFDAMGCQKAIAEKIIKKKADYTLALKGNHSGMQARGLVT